MADGEIEQPRDHTVGGLASEIVSEGEANQLSHPHVVSRRSQARREHPYHVTRRSVSMTRHHGPLPTAEYMREIREVIPDGPERILAMAEKNADHRRKMEEKEMDSLIEYNKGLLARSNRGLAAGLVVALALGTAAWNLISNGHEISGSILGSLDVVGLVSVFVIGRSHSGKQADADEAHDEEKSRDSHETEAPLLEEAAGSLDDAPPRS